MPAAREPLGWLSTAPQPQPSVGFVTVVQSARRSEISGFLNAEPEAFHFSLAGPVPTNASSRFSVKLCKDCLFVRLVCRIGSNQWFLMVRRLYSIDQRAYHVLFISSEVSSPELIAWRRRTQREWLRLLDHMGIASVECHANLSRGGYVWARGGFLPRDETQWRVVRDYTRSRWASLRPLVKPYLPSGELARLDRLLGNEASEVLTIWAHLEWWRGVDARILIGTVFESPQGITRSLGNLLLAGSSWWAGLHLNDPEAYSVFKESLEK